MNHADSLNGTIAAYYSDPGRPLQLQYDRDGMNCEFTLMTTGSGGKYPPQITRVVARSAPHTRQQMSTYNQRSPSRDMSENHDDDPQQAPSATSREIQREVIPEIETPQAETEVSLQAIISASNAELSLFLDPDETMEDNAEGEDNDDVLGWDVNMDNTVSFI